MILPERPETVEALCERLFALEAEHGLLDLEVDGVKLWQYLRMPIYYRLARACGVLGDPHPAPVGPFARMRERLSNLKSICLHNPFYASGPVDALVFDHPRSIMLDGGLVDIYTHFLLRQLSAEGQKVVVVEAPLNGLHRRQTDAKRRHLDFVHLCHRVDLRMGRYACSSQAELELTALNELVRDAFSADVNLRPLLRDGVSRFRSNYRIYRRLLAKLRPKKIYVVVAYHYLGALVKAAKDMGIEVVELQHGVFSRYHLGYSYPGRSTPLDYFPDTFVTWGRFWSELIALPIARKNVISGGFSYFHRMRDRYRESSRSSNRILVLSQGAIGRALAERIAACIDELDDLEVIYKLHPSEYDCWREYPGLPELARRANVQIVDRNVDLYRLLAEAQYQFGVFSTAIYEGVGMGCRTVLFDLPGCEYMERLLAEGLAVLHRKGDHLQKVLSRAAAIDRTLGGEELFGSPCDYRRMG